METILEKLKNSGLTGNESKVYYELLSKGELSANDIAKNTSIDRTLSYNLLKNLAEKGLVSHITKENKKYFKASDPSNLLNSIKEKEAYVTDIIATLKKIEKINKSENEVNVYEGRKAIKTFFSEFRKYKNACSFGATGKAYNALYESPHLAKEFQKLGITLRIITNLEYKNHPMTSIRNIETKYLDLKSNATTTIFKDKISIHLMIQNPMIIIIKSREIAESYQNYFEVLWNAAKK